MNRFFLAILCQLIVNYPACCQTPPSAREQTSAPRDGNPRPAKDIQELIDALSFKSADMRQSAADALGKSGSNAKSAIPGLLNTLRTDRDSDVRRAAMEALVEISTG